MLSKMEKRALFGISQKTRDIVIPYPQVPLNRKGHEMSRLVARKYCYEGQVQGVGFRRTTENVATSFQVTGYVMNLSDGRVEMHVEGPIEEVDHFVQAIDDKFQSKITRVTQQLVDPRKYDDFSVSFEKSRAEL